MTENTTQETNQPFPAKWSPVSERELRDAVEVRIGLVADKNYRRILHAFFASKERADAYFTLPARLKGPHSYGRGLAEEAVELARICGAAAMSIPGVGRNLVTTAALLAPAGAILAIGPGGEKTDERRMLHPDILASDLVAQAAREAGNIPSGTVDALRGVILGNDSPEATVLSHAFAMSVTIAAKRE